MLTGNITEATTITSNYGDTFATTKLQLAYCQYPEVLQRQFPKSQKRVPKGLDNT